MFLMPYIKVSRVGAHFFRPNEARLRKPSSSLSSCNTTNASKKCHAAMTFTMFQKSPVDFRQSDATRRRKLERKKYKDSCMRSRKGAFLWPRYDRNLNTPN